ncbi:hypothetical protein L1987_36497 [Smallanthus sonchifolius]|uniref:Uncharacterized protein n=1 Tax=Smallanthus sonchifolius TaxID=185202 RepID=A0ACB9HDL1_9ASTR|nr:hypothetical protein L1987_36497 [Smallanthus sonchifolius]
MASTLASSIRKSFKYDVFLSFQGEDTRKNFVDHLYHALKQKSIYTYRDEEEIKKGKRINDELIRSIEDSKFHIIVFSKNYASSSWCLDELVQIMECQKTIGQTAYPLFYDVEPTEVRKQSGAVGEAFAKHKEEEAAEKWRYALREAADLAGWELKNTFDGHEAKFIQKIVEEILLELRFDELSVDGKLVGMKRRVKEVVSSLETSIDDVRMLGIKGIGGGGKTTLARRVFDQISIMFEGSSFVENVREISKGSLSGLKSLQKQVLSDVLNKQDIIVNGVSDWKGMMRKMLCVRKVLVVLDDVDHIDQLEALAGEPNWFKPGSRIIITTREEQVLVAHGVPKNLILDVNMLSRLEAICLFNKYAFGREIPNQGYEMLSHQVVRYAAGLPLTIKVLGSFLRGKDELEWTDALERLKTIPLKETLEILELSYYSLEEDYKEIFLDVACILKGWKKEKAIRVLESCGFHARSGLRVLEQKSLINVSHSGCLSMHDHIEEMGKNIVRRLHPDDPSTHSRLWIREEIEDILIEDKGTEATRCIIVKSVNPVTVMKGFQNMKKLRFLDVICRIKESTGLDYDGYNSDIDYSNRHYSHDSYLGNDDIGEDWQYLPNGLRYLCWNGYPYKCLPKYFQANNLVGLEIFLSNIDQLWEGEERKVLKKLRFIDLCFCKLRTLDIGLLVNLERLNLVACENLVELHMPVQVFNLKYLNICRSKLKTLDLTCAQNLDTLKVKKCEDLVELHMPVDNLKLKHLSLQYSKLKVLNLMRTRNLEKLDIACEHLVELHMPVESLKLKHLSLQCSKLKNLNLMQTKNLETLDLACEYLVELQMPVESLKLKHLNLQCSKLKTLNLMRTHNLKELDLVCENLVELFVPVENFKLKSLNICFSKLRTLDIGQPQLLDKLIIEDNSDGLVELHLPVEKLKGLLLQCSRMKTLTLTRSRNLETLILVECEDLLELHMPIESSKLKIIYIRCSKLRTLNLTQSWNLERLDLVQCEDLVELHMPIESSKLKIIYIRCSKLRTLNLTQSWNLERLDLVQCEDLVELHMPIESPKLRIINIHNSKLRTLNLMQIRNLEKLDLEQCEDLLELHMPIESPKLRSINIRGSKLRTLYLGMSPYLKCLDLHDCFNLVDIHAPIGCLSGHVKFKPFLVNQAFPMVGSLAELHLIARSLGICPLHPYNDLPKFHFECIYKEILPSSTRNLEKLISLGLCACTNLVGLSGSICGLKCLRKLTLEGNIPDVPNELDQLECLEELNLWSAKIKHLPDSICNLIHLKILQLKSCWLLEQLPEDLGRLECLEELHLTDCMSLRVIPNSICEMKHLKCLCLPNCILVEKLPKEIGRLKCLKELNIQGTGIKDFPPSIFQVEDLLFLI